MTDTGGGKGFEGSRGRTRARLRRLVDLVAGTGGKTVPSRRPTQPVPVMPDRILPSVVWPELTKAGVYNKVFAAPELIYFLQQMARLIQMTPRGVDEVVTAFNVRPDSPFSTWQTKIRLGAPEQSAHRGRASHAFQAGSNRWAIDLLKRRDPTVFTMTHVVMAVSRDVDEALISSPHEILDEYLKLVIESLIADDPKLDSFYSGRLRKEYSELLRQLFARFDKSADWTELRIPKTMLSFPAMLRGND